MTFAGASPASERGCWSFVDVTNMYVMRPPAPDIATSFVSPVSVAFDSVFKGVTADCGPTSAMSGVDGVDSVLGPFDEFADGQVSDDEAVAIVRVQLDGASSDIAEETIAALVATAEMVDVRVEFAGQVFQDTTVGLTVSEVLGVLFAGMIGFARTHRANDRQIMHLLGNARQVFTNLHIA